MNLGLIAKEIRQKTWEDKTIINVWKTFKKELTTGLSMSL